MPLTDTRRVASLIKQAKELLGDVLVHQTKDGVMSGKIVEVEAYHQQDPASHTYRGQTAANQAMFGPPGRAYIYFTYGAHYCFNVSAGAIGEGAGILVRALEPLEGVDLMAYNRFAIKANQPIAPDVLKNLCNGPGKLTQALKIDKSLYGHDLRKPPLYLQKQPNLDDKDIQKSTRIGISRAVEELLRFSIKDSAYVSRE